MRVGVTSVWTSKGVSRLSLSASAATRSSRSTSSCAMVSPRSSARASRSRSSTSACIRCASGISVVFASSPLSSSGWATATSNAEMIVVSGLRSSCDASPTNRCWAEWPASIRASISFMVSAKADISSRFSGTGTRSVRSDVLISATRVRIASTDRIERRHQKVGHRRRHHDDDGRRQRQRDHDGLHRREDDLAALADQHRVAAARAVHRLRAEPDLAVRRIVSGMPMCSPSPISEIGTIGVSGADGERLTTVPSGVMTCTARIRWSVLSSAGVEPGRTVGFEVRGDVADARGCGAVDAGQHGPVQHRGEYRACRGRAPRTRPWPPPGPSARICPSSTAVFDASESVHHSHWNFAISPAQCLPCRICDRSTNGFCIAGCRWC